MRTLRIFNKGFTLIELLVVVSIIGVLSSIVIGSLQNARIKATNTRKNSIAYDYQIALELYFNDHGKYPDPGSNSTFCLGDYPTDNCWVGTNAENTTLNAALAPYIPSLPADTTPTMYNFGGFSFNYWGIIYRCVNQDVSASGRCTNYQIYWFINLENQTCPGDIPLKSQGGITQCALPPSPYYTI